MYFLLVGPDLESNLSLAYLVSALREAGHRAQIAPFNEAADAATVLQAARAADVVGLSLSFQVRAPDFLELARDLKTCYPGLPVIAGGHFASCAAEALLTDSPALDLIVLHEGEQTLVELAALGGEMLTRAGEVAGLWYRAAGVPTRSATRPILADLDRLPRADRSGPSRLVAGVPTAYMMGSRGCVRSCDYCCITTLHRMAPGPRFRRRDPEQVVAEMAELYHGRGVRQFVFHDDNFLVPSARNNHARLDAYEQAIQAAGLEDIGLVMKCGPTDLDEESLRRLKRMGLLRIFLGIESGSQCGLDSIGRKQTTRDTERALSLCEAYDVSSQYTMIIFNPEATAESMLADLDFVERHPSHPLNYCRAELYAGTPLEQRLLAEGRTQGDYMARTYRYRDERVAQIWELGSDLFAGRCWGDGHILGQSIRLDHQVAVLRHFYAMGAPPAAQPSEDGVLVRTLARDFGDWQQRLNLDTAGLFRELVRGCADSLPTTGGIDSLFDLLDDLHDRELASRQRFLDELCQLRERIDELVEPVIALAQQAREHRFGGHPAGPMAAHAVGGRLPSSAPRHATAVLVAAGLLAGNACYKNDAGVMEAPPPPYNEPYLEDEGVAEAAPPPYDVVDAPEPVPPKRQNKRRDSKTPQPTAKPAPPEREPEVPVRQDQGVAEAAPPPYERELKYDVGVAEAAPPPYEERGRPLRIMIASVPPSQVFIDGRRLGNTPLVVNRPLPPGKHLLRFVNRELGIDQKQIVQVTRDQTQLRVRAKLEPNKAR